MPNGYTAAIYEGKDVTLRDYLMGVARGYTLAIMQRDEDLRKPVRRVEPQTRYHDEGIDAAEKRLREVAATSVEEANRKAAEEYKAACADWEIEKDRRLAMRARYEAMVQQVEAWEPDPLVAYLKEGALKHLVDSMKFDCGEPGEEMRYRPYPKLLAGAEWIDEQVRKARKDIDYHREERAKELKRTAERNAHIDAFLRSLPALPVEEKDQ